MDFLRLIVGKVFNHLPKAIIYPWPSFLLIVSFLVARRRALEKQLLGVCRVPFWREVAGNALLGIGAGFVCSLVLLFLGITLNTQGFFYLILLALFLMLFELRYLCLAYAAGLLSLISLLTGQPKLHIPGLLALVAVLHITESLLIAASGDQWALPVFFRREGGRTVGGYLMQRVWPMPLICLAMATLAEGHPSWWPLIPLQLTPRPVEILAPVLIPAAVALGYTDLALASEPKAKARQTAGLLAAYSLILLGLALASVRTPGLAWAAALFAPFGHEAVLFLARRTELRREPLFVQGPGGVTILAVIPGSRAYLAGLRPGRVITEVNGQPVHTKAEFLAQLEKVGILSNITTMLPDGVEVCRHDLHGDAQRIGLVLAPSSDEPAQFHIGPWRFLPRGRRGV